MSSEAALSHNLRALAGTSGGSNRTYDRIAAFYERIETLPRFHLRRIGLLAMQVGSGLTLASLPFSIASMHIGFVVACAGALLCRPPVHRIPGFMAGVAFSLWILLSIFINRMPSGDLPMRHFGITYTWLSLPIAAIAFHSRSARIAALSALAAVSTAIAILAAAQFLIGYDRSGSLLHIRALPTMRYDRVGGTLGGVLTYALASIMVGLLFMSRLTTAGMPRLLAYCGRISSVLGSLLSCSRMALLAAVAAIGAYVTARDRKKFAFALGLMIALSIIICILLAAIVPRKLNGLADGDDQRWQIWEIASKVAQKHPVFGVGGREAFMAAYKSETRGMRSKPRARAAQRAQHAHNNELVLASEHGLPAVFLHFAFLGALLLFFFRLRRTESEAFGLGLALLVAWFIAGQFNNLIGQAESSYALYLCLAVAMSCAAAAAPASAALPSHDPSADESLLPEADAPEDLGDPTHETTTDPC
jgi:O-antigen ligase